jgi:hypothetical protein
MGLAVEVLALVAELNVLLEEIECDAACGDDDREVKDRRQQQRWRGRRRAE